MLAIKPYMQLRRVSCIERTEGELPRSAVAMKCEVSFLAMASHGVAPAEKLRIGLRMETGEGEASYSQNSEIQGAMLPETGPHLAEAIRQLRIVDGSPVRVADFGCSVGANALAWAHLAATSVLQNAHSKSTPCPEIHYFFADLPSNDFSSLFRELVGEDGKSKPPYFAAAVGGSFHDRLFPRGALNIAISTYSLHWMSKIPEAVLDVSSPAYNKGRVWIDGGNPVVAEAYAEVARQDLLNFFTHRASELAPAGLLFVVCMCRAEHGRPDQQTGGEFQKANPCSGMFEDSWDDLVAQGVIQPQERDSFNIPIFHPSKDEIEEAINKTKAYNIKCLEVQRDHRWLVESSHQTQHLKKNPALLGMWAKNFVKAIYNPLVETHLDSPRAQKLWERLEHNVTAYVKRTQNVCLSMPGANYALVILSRKL